MKECISHELSSKWRILEEHRFVSMTSYKQWAMRSSIWQPPTDVSETKDSILIRVEIAGMRDAEFEVSLEKRLLVIRGVRHAGEQYGAYLQMEIQSGEFVSIVELPTAIDPEKVEAEYKDGFLNVVLPKTEFWHIDVDEE